MTSYLMGQKAQTLLRVVSALAVYLLLFIVSTGSQAASGHCSKANLSCPQLIYEGLTYPYPREPGSYLFIDGGVYPYANATENLLGDSTVYLPGGKTIKVSDLLAAMGLEDRMNLDLVPVAGYGSNPAPSQLSRKFAKEILDRSVVMPVMKGWIDEHDVVWTPFFTSYGALPSTIYPSPGVRADIWVNWMTEPLVRRMDESERLSGGRYQRVDLSEASYDFDGPNPEQLQLYVSCFGALKVDGKIHPLSAVPAEGRKTAAMDVVEVLGVVQPVVAPDLSVLEMIHQAVSNPDQRRLYTSALAPFRTFREEGEFSKIDCPANAN
ncbi:MAG: hypothetical protein AAGB11_19720 [Pseudomonadota bacterium]